MSSSAHFSCYLNSLVSVQSDQKYCSILSVHILASHRQHELKVHQLTEWTGGKGDFSLESSSPLVKEQTLCHNDPACITSQKSHCELIALTICNFIKVFQYIKLVVLQLFTIKFYCLCSMETPNIFFILLLLLIPVPCRLTFCMTHSVSLVSIYQRIAEIQPQSHFGIIPLKII